MRTVGISHDWAPWAAATVAAVLLAVGGPALARDADGRLGLIQRPASTHPALVRAGETFAIAAQAGADSTGWTAELAGAGTSIAPVKLALLEQSYDAQEELWHLEVEVPAGAPEELYDLRLSHEEAVDESRIAVKVFVEWPERYTIAHFSDTQNLALPGVTATMRGIIKDLNALQPTFAIATGDLISTGEAHEYRDYIEMLEKSRVPVFHIPGNHDIFWLPCWKRETYQERYERFIGPRDYSFDFGDHHFAGVEISGYKNLCPHTKLTEAQIEWLDSDLAAASDAPFKVLFGHQREYKSDALESLVLEHELNAYLYGHVHEDEVTMTEPALFAAVGWAGNGKYRMIAVEDDEIASYTYAGGDIASIDGAYAVSRDIRRGLEPREATIKYTSGLADSYEVFTRIEMPPRGDGRYVADGGEIWQTVSADSAEYVYIRGIDVEADAVTLVNVGWERSKSDGGDDAPISPAPEREPSAGGCGIASGGAGSAAWWLLILAPIAAAGRRARRRRENDHTPPSRCRTRMSAWCRNGGTEERARVGS